MGQVKPTVVMKEELGVKWDRASLKEEGKVPAISMDQEFWLPFDQTQRYQLVV